MIKPPPSGNNNTISAAAVGGESIVACGFLRGSVGATTKTYLKSVLPGCQDEGLHEVKVVVLADRVLVAAAVSAKVRVGRDARLEVVPVHDDGVEHDHLVPGHVDVEASQRKEK